jgi:hypothetical protein
VAWRRTEVWRLVGRYGGLSGDRRGAMRLYQRSLEAGQALGAEPEIARTYEELGARLREVGGTAAAAEGLDAQRCFERAQQTYRSLALARDLKRLESLEDQFDRC